MFREGRIRKLLKRRLRVGRWSVSLGVLAVAALIVVVVGGGAVYARLGGGANDPSTTVNLQKGLIGWWKLDGNAKDATPYANNGTINGGTMTADRKGKANAAYSQTGTAGQRIILPTTGPYTTLGTTSFTVSSWVKSSSSTSQVYVSGASSSKGYRFGMLNGRPFGLIGDGTNYVENSIGTTTVADGSWHSLTITYTYSGNWSMTAYIDGVSVGTLSAPTVTGTITNSLGVLGAMDTNGTFRAINGSMDDARIYNRVLSVAEIKALYETYDGGVNLASGEKGLLAWWKFDSNTKDSTPYARTLVATDTTLAADRRGSTNSAYQFNGTSSNMTSSLISAITRTGNYTVSAWIKSNNTGVDQMIWQNSSSCSDRNGMGVGSGQAYFNYYDGTAYTSKRGTIVAGEWNHIVGVNTGGTLTLYINGVPQNAAGTIYTHCQVGLWIGSTSTSSTPQWFNGLMDDIRVYNRSLVQDEVSRLYTTYNSQINLNSSPSGSSGSNINTGLVADWGFNGNSKDNTPYANNGVVNGSTLTTDRRGRANSAYSFNGTSDYINCGTSSSLQPTGAITISAWVYVTAYSSVLSGIVNYGGGGYWLSLGSNGAPYLYITSNTAVGSSTPLPLNQWRHIVATYDGASGKMYVNGSLTSTQAWSGAISGYALNCFIGSNKGVAGRYFQGSLDDVRIYNRALSATEAQTLYNTYR